MRKERIKRTAAVIMLLLLIANLSTAAYAESSITYNVNTIDSSKRTPSNCEYTFSDIAMMKLYAYGALPEDYLTPQERTDEPMTRSEAADLLYDLFYAGETGSLGGEAFTDCDTLSVRVLYQNGVLKGTGGGLFQPDDEITEVQLLTMLLRVMGYCVDNLWSAESVAETIGLAAYDNSDDEFTLGEAAQDIVSALDCKLNDSEDTLHSMLDEDNIKTMVFPFTLRLDVTSVEDAFEQIERAADFVPSRIVIYSNPETAQELLIRLETQRWGAQYGDDEKLRMWNRYDTQMPVEDWIFDHVADTVSIGFQTDKSLLNGDEREQAMDVLKASYDANKLSWKEYCGLKEYYDALYCFDGGTVSLSVSYSLEQCMVAELDDVFYIMQDPAIAEAADAYYQERVQDAVNVSDYAVIRQAIRAISNDAEYDYAITAPSGTLLGFFQNGKIVCAGYASLFQYLMLRAGIRCVKVRGDTTSPNKPENASNHMWNKVKLEGKWYNVDVCWADTSLNLRRNMLKSDSSFISGSTSRWITGSYGGWAYASDQDYE